MIVNKHTDQSNEIEKVGKNIVEDVVSGPGLEHLDWNRTMSPKVVWGTDHHVTDT